MGLGRATYYRPVMDWTRRDAPVIAALTTLVAALAGHRAITMTLHYVHLAPSHLRTGIQVLEEWNTRQKGEPALSTDVRVTLVSQDFGGIA